jgi:hypothetical protein
MQCSFVRWQLSNTLDSGRPQPWLARRHVARCASCRSYAARLAALDGVLVRTAILASAPRSPTRTLVPRIRLALVATVATLVAVLAWRTLGSPQDPAAPSRPAVAIREAHTERPGLGASIAAATTALFAKDPLHDELTALRRDALRGMAVAFHVHAPSL